MKSLSSLSLSCFFFLYSCHTLDFKSSRFSPRFYQKIDVRELPAKVKYPGISSKTVTQKNTFSDSLQVKRSTTDKINMSKEPGMYQPFVLLTFKTAMDTIPSQDTNKHIKFKGKERVSFALVIGGTVLLMLGIGLGIYFLVALLMGGSVAGPAWYFLAAVLLIGLLVREWGLMMNT